MNNKYIYKLSMRIAVAALTMTSCSESWLKPEPLSFYTPENTYINADGMYGALTACDRNARHEYYGDANPLITELIFSDVCIEGTTDKAGPAQNMNIQITPTAQLNNTDYNKIGWYWLEGFKGLKYANVVISRIDNAKYKNEDERNEVLGAAYFQRSRRYYQLVHQFGDVPTVNKEIQEPKLDFYSVDRWAILRYIKKDMEFAFQWVKDDNINRGRPTKGACGHLLTKINLALGEFDAAIKSASDVINSGKYKLMTERFGTAASWIDPRKPNATITGGDVISDLHWHQNRSIAANKEVLYMVISREELIDGSDRIQTIRDCGPYFGNTGNFIQMPSGKAGMTDQPKIARPEVEVDVVSAIGRGINRARSTWYATHLIWDDPNDLRHQFPNWRTMNDMVYNNYVNKTDPDYLKPVQTLRDAQGRNISTKDTIRTWNNGWPHYKLFNPDPTATQPVGGRVDWYIYRLAETYLLRAEAYVWKGQPELAMADINKVRTRAGCAPYTDPSKITIRTVIDERARELFFEEPRKTELTRIAYIFAKTGKTAPNGKTYSLSSFSDKNFWYDHLMEVTDFYNKGVKTVYGNEYAISPYHVLWPIPNDAILANVQGLINQNKGYSGYEKNKPALQEVPDNQ